MNKVEVTSTYYYLIIKIDDVEHLKLKLSDIYGYQSWTDRVNKNSIEYYCIHGNICCEYQDREVWKTILKGLENIKFN